MSQAGLKQIVVCDKGTLLTTPANPLAIGLREKAELQITQFKPVTTYKEQKLRNMRNFKFDGISLQPTIEMLKRYVGWVNLNSDVQIVTNPQSATAGSEDVFQFAGSNPIGIGFEFKATEEKRTFKAMFETAMEEPVAKALIDSADSTSAVSFSGITGEGADYNYYHAPYYMSIESPTGAEIFGKQNFISRELTIKTEGKKSIYNSDIIDWIVITLAVTGREADIAKLVSLLNQSMSPSVLWKEQNNASGTNYDAFDFAAGVLTQSEEFVIDDEERKLKVEFTGKVPLYDVTFALGDGNGGDAGDTDGFKGGTMKFGY